VYHLIPLRLIDVEFRLLFSASKCLSLYFMQRFRTSWLTWFRIGPLATAIELINETHNQIYRFMDHHIRIERHHNTKKNQREKSTTAELFETRKQWDENVCGCFLDVEKSFWRRFPVSHSDPCPETDLSSPCPPIPIP